MRKSPDSLAKAIRRATERRAEQREYGDILNLVDSSISAGGVGPQNCGTA
jgi:hypothetical protein